MSTSMTVSPWWRRGLTLSAGIVASVAMGASAGTPAQAGTDAEWDLLASCESSNNWSINTGNGYYGGLQFSQGSWQWAGGTQYAALPHQATREQQIATAERLLDLQHVSRAWPACSAKTGLTHAQLQSGSATPPGGQAPTPAPEPDTPDPGSGDAGSNSSSAGTHRVRSGDTLSSISRQYDVAGGWRALYDANRDRVANPSLIRVGQVLRVPGTASSAPEPSAPPSSTQGGSYTVRAGDTLSGIARSQGVVGGWNALYQANTDRISNPNRIFVGQQLQLP